MPMGPMNEELYPNRQRASIRWTKRTENKKEKDDAEPEYKGVTTFSERRKPASV